MYEEKDLVINGECIGHLVISGESSHRAEFTKMKKGSIIFLEVSPEGRSHIAERSSSNLGPSNWNNSIIELFEINRFSREVSPPNPGAIMKFIVSLDSTRIQKQIGEHGFEMLQANEDDAKIVIVSEKIGRMMLLEASKMPILVRHGGFLFGTQGIILDQYTLTGSDGLLYSNLLGFDSFQKISGHGYFAIHIEGDCSNQEPLLPGEIRAIDPNYLVAMSDTVRIIDTFNISSSLGVRNIEGKNYDLYLQANALGGWIIRSDLSQKSPDTSST